MGHVGQQGAIVTRAGHGIGRGPLDGRKLAKHGATVIVNDLGGSVTGELRSSADLTVDIIKARIKGLTSTGRVPTTANRRDDRPEPSTTLRTAGHLVNNASIVTTARSSTCRSTTSMPCSGPPSGTWIRASTPRAHWRALNKDTGQKVNGRIINTVSGAG